MLVLGDGGVIERLVVEVEGNVHLDLDRAGLDSGARRRHRSEKGARGEGEKSNEKCALYPAPAATALDACRIVRMRGRNSPS